jgi:hypothetical protein
MFKITNKIFYKKSHYFHYSKFISSIKKFCFTNNFQGINKNNNINESELHLFDEKVGCLFQINDFQNYFDFYHSYNHKLIINSHLEKKLLFIDYLSTYLEKDFYKNNKKFDTFSEFLREIILTIQISELKQIQSIYVISLIESLSNLLYYPSYFKDSGKIWIALENLILSTNFLNNLELSHFYLILRCFEFFFQLEDTTVNPEELFESIEYHLIKLLKNQQINLKNNYELIELAKIYIVYGKNVEASLEFYESVIDILSDKYNIKFLDKSHRSLVVELFFSTLLIREKVCRGKKIEEFIKLLDEKSTEYEKVNENIIKEYKLGSEHLDMLDWTKKKLLMVKNKKIINIKFWENTKI